MTMKNPERLFFAVLASLSFGLSLSQPTTASEIGPVTIFTPDASHHLEIKMKALTTDVTVGGYHVKDNNSLQVCDHTGTHCADPYVGAVLQLNPRDTLKINLQNALASNGLATPDHCMVQAGSNPNEYGSDNSLFNLHTHGLLVSPYAKQISAGKLFGDNIFSCTSSSSIGGSVVGSGMQHEIALENLTLNREHPLGVDWVHPHVHGIAKAQVSSGMSSMIVVGDINKQLCVKPAPDGEQHASNCVNIDTRDVKHLMLKDAQLYKRTDSADYYNNYADQNPDFCGANKLDSANFGECAVDLTALGDDEVKTGRWVFTINGVKTPHWEIGPDKYEIWRVLNASANVTYHLSLQPLTYLGGVPQKAPFQVLDMDGSGLASHGSGSELLPTATDILLMPSSRADLLVQSPKERSEDVTYALVNDNFQTGFQIGDADVWPHVTLATITFKASRVHFAARVAVTPTPLATEMHKAQPVDEAKLAMHLKDDCLGLDDPSLTTEQRQFYHDRLHVAPPWKRRFYFGVFGDTNTFSLGQTLVDEKGKEFDYFGGAIDPRTNPVKLWPFDMKTALTRLCVRKDGGDETWQLVNVSNEIYNFHIHQIKFGVVRETSGPNAGQPIMRAPSPIDRADIPQKLLFRNGPADLLHDVIIVPRGQTNCQNSLAHKDASPSEAEHFEIKLLDPNATGYGCDGSGSQYDNSGMIEVKLNFNGNQLAAFDDGAGGRKNAKFVYHCHILEHEDKGMMAGITVIDPSIYH